MQRVRIDVQNVVTNVIVKEGNEANVFVINNIFAKKETKGWETNVNIRDDSGRIFVIWQSSSNQDPVGVMNRPYERVTFAVQSAGNLSYFRPRGFLD